MRVTEGLLLLCFIMGLTSCSIYQNSDVGKVTGTIGGGLLASPIGQGTGRVLAVGSGMVTGFIVGNHIGNVMDHPLARNLNSTLYYNLKNQASCWVDGFGTRYILTPTSDLIAVNDIPACRQYCMITISKSCIHQERGIACLRPDETWCVLCRTIIPGIGSYRALVKYNHIFDYLKTTSPARQCIPCVDAVLRY